MDNKTRKRAAELMRSFAQITENKREFTSRIAAEKEAYDSQLKALEAELIEIGQNHRADFDVDGNLVFEHGYLHAAQNTVVVQTKKFDLAVFAEERPDLIDVKLKVSPIKKLWLDNTSRKDLKALGVDVKTEESIQVLLPKK